MKVLFCATHVGLLRHYASVLQLLVDRGHSVHVACEDFDRGLGQNADTQRVTGTVAGVTFGNVPARERTAWTAWSYWLHLLMDWVHYFHPRFDGADALRVRVEHQVPRWTAAVVRAIRHIDPTGRRVLRVLRALDRITPPSRVIQSFVAEAAPDLVMVSPYVYVGFEQADHVKAARALGIRTAVCIASWDNLTNKGVIGTVPDRLFVWNDAQRAEAVSLHAVPADRVIVTGAQLFDRWFDRQPSRSREEFCRMVGLDPDAPYILYTGSSDFIAPREEAFVRQWVQAVRRSSDPVVAGAGILIRPHPKNSGQFIAFDPENAGNVKVWPLGAKTFDPTFDDDFFDSLYHSRVVVGINTSAQIEAAIVGRSVRTWRAADFVHSQDGTLHFQYLAADDGGLLRVAESAKEHLGHLADVLSGSERVEERTLRFVESFVRPHGLSVTATQVFTDAVEGMIAIQAAPRPLPVWGHAARVFMFAFGAVLKPQRRRREDARPGWALPIRVVVAVSVYTAALLYRVRDAGYAFQGDVARARKGARRVWRSVAKSVPQLRFGFGHPLRTIARRQQDVIKSFRRGRRTLVRSVQELGKTYRRASRQVARATRIVAKRTIRVGRKGIVQSGHGAVTLSRRVFQAGRRGVRQSRHAARTLARRVVRAGRRGVLESRYVASALARRVVRAGLRGAIGSRVIAGTMLRKVGLRRTVKERQPPVETV